MKSGELKAFWQGNEIFPVTLITTNAHHSQVGDSCLWLIHRSDGDQICSSKMIVVDVTPEKRYAVWNHKLQRFVVGHPDHKPFLSKGEAEAWLYEKYGKANGNYYVVEWEIKKND